MQMDLLTVILDGRGNITAVGDEDQSIYRWRGAELANILSFEKFFPGARVVALEENYRSTEPILTVAGGLIATNRGRRGKDLFTNRQGGEPVRLHVAADERGEARWVADQIESMVGNSLLKEMAVLMRTNAQTRPFEEELTRRRVPYRVVGGLRFWQRAEIKDALAYLRLAVRPGDLLSFERVINVPARGIGAATMDVSAQCRAGPRAEPARSGASAAGWSQPTGRAFHWKSSFWFWMRLPNGAKSSPRETSSAGCSRRPGFLPCTRATPKIGWRGARTCNSWAAAVAEAAARGQELEELLDSVALLEENDEQGAADGVALMTLHSAKGLEFDIVFLAGLEDGLLPHANSRDEPEGLEEERRLAYVGMTRARKWLALTGARSRFLFGQRQPTRLSRFSRRAADGSGRRCVRARCQLESVVRRGLCGTSQPDPQRWRNASEAAGGPGIGDSH